MLELFNKKRTILFSAFVSLFGFSYSLASNVEVQAKNIYKFAPIELQNNQSHIALGKNPYEGKGFTATSYFPCSVGNTSHNKYCPAGIMRQGNGKAWINVLFPNGSEITYNFANGNVTAVGVKLTWGKNGDDWYIGIDNNLYVIIPDAAVTGG
jgi:hypothetical protein